MSSCQAWWSRSNNWHFLSCPNSRQFWMNPTLFKCKVNDGTFNVFDGHWWFTDSQHTCTFTWCRAYPPSEFCTRHMKQNGLKFWTSEYTKKNIIYKLLCFRKVPYCGILPGKLFVCSSWFRASFQLLWNTRSFHFGMMLPRGHPWELWQKGTPHSMHRAACTRNPLRTCPKL